MGLLHDYVIHVTLTTNFQAPLCFYMYCVFIPTEPRCSLLGCVCSGVYIVGRLLLDTYLLTCTGGGVELPVHYPQWKVEHGKMEPPNIILASLNKLMEGELPHQVAVRSDHISSCLSSHLPLTLTPLPLLPSLSPSFPPHSM